MPPRDLIALVRERDDQLRKESLSLAADLRIRRLLGGAEHPASESQKSRWAMFCVALAMLITLIVAVQNDWLRPLGLTALDAGDFATGSSRTADCTIRSLRDGDAFVGPCTLQLGTAAVRTDAQAEVRRTATDLEVVRGRAWFDVAPVAAGAAPVRVQVGGGVIEVVGTRFMIEQGPSEGSVHLLEGKIRFWANERDSIEIRPGHRLRWSNVDSTPAPAPAKAKGPSPSAVGPTAGDAGAVTPDLNATTAAQAKSAPVAHLPRSDGGTPALAIEAESSARELARETAMTDQRVVDETVERVMTLRASGRYSEALTRLEMLQGRELDLRAAEAVSFEEGNILEHVEEPSTVCAHWKGHVHRFPAGRYRAIVDAKIMRLACP
jgi:hypothetical protein